AAGAAHEMNNPLAVISGRSQMLATRLKDGPDAADARAVAEAAGRLSELITSLHLLAEAPEACPVASDVAEIGGEAAQAAGERCGGAERVEVSASPGAQAVVDRSMVRTVLIELIANGLEALPDGLVRVRIEPAGADNRLIGGWVRIGIQD